MRDILLISSGVALMAIGAPAWGQTKADRTQEIICELTGDCDPVQVSEDQLLDKGETAGFSFTRPGSKPAASATPAARPGSRQVSAYVPQSRSAKATKSTAYRPASSAPRGVSEMRVTFALGSAEVMPSSRDEIDAFVKALQSPALSGKRFRVEGHTDASGARDVNERLSQARAEAVAAMLKAKGIDTGRIEAKGYGPDRPLAGAGRMSPQNRRVELVPIGS